MRIDPQFAALLEPLQRAALDAEPAVVCGLSPDLAIAYWNDAWERFARNNGGADVLTRFPLGASFLDAVSGPLRAFYETLLRSIGATGEPWEHLYECSSADVVRNFHLRVVPLAGGALVMIHSLAVERNRTAPHYGDDAIDDALLLGGEGLILQCSSCRRVLRRDLQTWEWRRRFMEPQPLVSHGLCNACCELHYPASPR